MFGLVAIGSATDMKVVSQVLHSAYARDQIEVRLAGTGGDFLGYNNDSRKEDHALLKPRLGNFRLPNDKYMNVMSLSINKTLAFTMSP